jgi:hypothetical protein
MLQFRTCHDEQATQPWLALIAPIIKLGPQITGSLAPVPREDTISP